MISTLFPVLFNDDGGFRYMYKILCSFGNSGALVCQLAILMRWFKSQFSMSFVMAIFYYFIPMVSYILAVSLWNMFFVHGILGMIDLDRNKLQWTEFIVYAVSIGCSVLMAMMDCKAQYSIRKLSSSHIDKDRVSILLKRKGTVTKNLASDNRTMTVNEEEPTEFTLWGGFQTLEKSYFLTVFVMVCMNIACRGLVDNTAVVSVYKFGYLHSYNSMD